METGGKVLVVLLLYECNLSCRHCGRGRFGGRELLSPGYRLTLEQMERCLDDLGHLERVRRVHANGGEPTLWRDGDADLVDLLVAVARAGRNPSVITNGRAFEDRASCREFLGRYLAGADRELGIYLSIDTFHGNFDPDRGRAACLDNLLSCREELLPGRPELLRIEAGATVSKDPATLLPESMLEHYLERGVEFDANPLLPMGKALAFREDCPDLESDRREDLGAFHAHRDRHRERARGREGLVYVVLRGDEYFLGSRRIARLGELRESTLSAP